MARQGISSRPVDIGGGGTAGSVDLERYRHYLTLLARAQVLHPAMRDRLDVSGIVQQTFLEAHQRAGEFRDQGTGMAAWLRRILVNNIADALRTAGRVKRDVARERSIEQALQHSSVRLGDLLASDQSSPSRHLQNEERALLLADAMAELSDGQREVILLRHWHGRSLAEIAAQLDRTPASVVGLLQRGLTVLRAHLAELRRQGAL
jgi:RNA polymerase sigma-70 factor (ECF subfamily)